MMDNFKLFLSTFFWLLLITLGLAVLFALPVALVIEVLQNVIA